MPGTPPYVWLFGGFLYRLAILIGISRLLGLRQWRAALMLYGSAAIALVRADTDIRHTAFVLLTLSATALIGHHWLTARRAAQDLPPAAGPARRAAVGQPARALAPWLFAGFLVWPIASGGVSLYKLGHHLAYAANLGEVQQEVAEIRRLAQGRDVALGYYPAKPVVYFLSGMRPIAGYLYVWPWVAEVGLSDIIAATAREPAIVFLDCDAVRAGYPLQPHLLPLETHLEREYVSPAPCVYVSPELVEGQ